MVDGIVYGRQAHGGINTYFNKVMTYLSNKPDVWVDVIVPKRALGAIPNGRIAHLPAIKLKFATGISWRLDQWLTKSVNKLFMTGRAWTRRQCVYHSTYFTTIYPAVPQVATVYDMNHERFAGQFDEDWSRWLRKTYRSYVECADKIIAISNSTKADIVRFYGIPEDRIEVTHLATDPREFYFDDDLGRCEQFVTHESVSRPFVLFVGGRMYYKNFSRLLTAFGASQFSKRGSLLVVGPAWAETERAEIESLGLASKVTLIENPPVRVLRVLYSRAAAFVYPSLFEGFGIPLLEAMACKTAVAAADTEVFREVAGPAAQYFDPTSVEGMANAIDEASAEPRRQALIEAGESRVAQFSWERCAEATYRVYREVLGT
jgi:glycosyltransferase involved in cell wall biosynthesis